MKSTIFAGALFLGYAAAESIAPAPSVVVDLVPDFMGYGAALAIHACEGKPKDSMQCVSPFSFVKCSLGKISGMRREVESVIHDGKTCQPKPSPTWAILKAPPPGVTPPRFSYVTLPAVFSFGDGTNKAAASKTNAAQASSASLR